MPLQPTLALARFIERSSATSLPADVVHEAKRAIVNWVGCAVGASQHATVSRALAALRPFMGPPQATMLGRGERVDILYAVMLNGISSHTFDFDDTHLKTVIHPTGPVASGILALAEYRIGSLGRPMSDGDLDAKFRALCAPILPGNAAEEVLGACWNLDTAENAGALAALTVPCDEERAPHGSGAPVLAAEQLG